MLCIQDGLDDEAAIPAKVLNTYCFVSTTYTVVGPAGMGPDTSRTPPAPSELTHTQALLLYTTSFMLLGFFLKYYVTY